MDQNIKKLAAIDLGSNSFHMVVATLEGKILTPIDTVKNTVRLAEGLDNKNHLSRTKINEATDCLKTFGQLIQGFSPDNVRCVGTNTLRKATNINDFILVAEAALGFQINVIGGREEARLVYQGAARTITQTKKHRLVIDIGGGSTEFIIGQENNPLLMESLGMGCVNFTKQFFSKGKITRAAVQKAILAARQKLEWISDEYVETGWQEVIGCSGTIKAIAAILEHQFNAEGKIHYKQLKKLLDLLIDFRYIERLELEGLSSNRQPIIIGGVCVLLAAFEELCIDTMSVSTGALREGLLYDMQNCVDGRDIRFLSVQKMVEQYNVDTQQTNRIKNIADVLCKQLNLKERSDIKNTIDWTIDLHEIGLGISHINTAQHSAYIVEQSDMPGFSREFQNTIGMLVRLHRGKLKRKLIDDRPRTHKKICIILFIVRLAVRLARGRDKINLSRLRVVKEDKSIKLKFPEDFLKNHPLTVADLEQETIEIKKIGYNLKFKDSNN